MVARGRSARCGGSSTQRRARALAVLPFALVAVLLLPALAGSALAQQDEACRPPRLLASRGPALWEPGSAFTYQLAVENANVAPVESVSARLDATAPPGWSVALSQTSLMLRPQDAPLIAVTVTAPQRGTGVASGDLVLAVQFTCHRDGGLDTRASATTTVPLALTDVRVPWLLLTGGLTLVGAVSASVWAVRWRQGPIGAESDADEKPVVPGKSVQFPLRVVNRRRGPDTVTLQAHGVPEGWSSHVALPEITLEGREERDLWIALRCPAAARPGDEVTVTVTARGTRAQKGVATVTLKARVRRE